METGTTLIDWSRIISLVSSGLFLTLALLIIALYRNVKLREENRKLKEGHRE